MLIILKKYPRLCALISLILLGLGFCILLIREFLLNTFLRRPLEYSANMCVVLGILSAYICLIGVRFFLRNTTRYVNLIYWFLIVSPWIIALSARLGPFFALQQLLIVGFCISALVFPLCVFKTSRQACILAVPFALLLVFVMAIVAIVVLHKFIEIWPEEPTYIFWGLFCAVLASCGIFCFLFYTQRVRGTWLKYCYAFVVVATIVVMVPEIKRMIKPLFLERLHTYYVCYKDAQKAVFEDNKPILLVCGTHGRSRLEKISENYLFLQLCAKYQKTYVMLRLNDSDNLPEYVRKEIDRNMGFLPIAVIDPIKERYTPIFSKWKLQSLKELLADDLIIYENCT